MSTEPDSLPVLIVSFRAAGLLEKCLISVQTFHPGQDVLIWDNTGPASADIHEVAERYPEFHWHFSDRNIGFAAAVNRLAQMIPERNFLLLNPDAELVAPLEKTRALIGAPGVAAVGPMTVQEEFGAPALLKRQVKRLDQGATPWDVANRRLNLGQALLAAAGPGWGRIRSTPFSSRYQTPPGDVDGYIFGSCLAIGREAWAQIGGFDEEFFLYGEEQEWQYRAITTGWKIRLADECAVKHLKQGTVGEDHELQLRSEELQFANGILFYESIYGEKAAEFYLAWVSLFTSLKRRVRHRSKSCNRKVRDVLVTACGPDHVIHSRIATAIAIERDGYEVTVVSLQRLGVLQMDLPPTIRLIRMAWWWPWLPDGKLPASVVAGPTSRERAFARLLRLRRAVSGSNGVRGTLSASSCGDVVLPDAIP